MNAVLILLDRDGVLNHEREGYVKSPDELVLIPGAAAAVARLNRAGHKVAVCTNQGVVGRGLIDEAMLATIHEALKSRLALAGARLDALFYAPDHPDNPGLRRKPGPGMLQEAMAQFDAKPEDTVMIGDSLRDLEAAAAAGCRRILVLTGHGRRLRGAGLPAAVQPVAVHPDLAAAVSALIGGSP